MRFFHLVQKHNRVRLPTYCLCQLAAFFIAYISRRRSDQTAHAEFLHIFAHINPDNVVFIVKQRFCQCLGQFCFSDTGRPQEEERSKRTVGILNAGTGTQNSFADFFDSFVLANHTLMQNLVHVQELFPFSLHELCHRNSCPASHNPCDFFFGNFVPEQ